MAEASWIEVCDENDIDKEDVMRFDHGNRTFAIYRSEKGQFFATDGYCTHEKFHLADGFVMGNLIECPKHNGQFDYTNGKAKKTPVCVDLQTYPTKVENSKVLIQISG